MKIYGDIAVVMLNTMCMIWCSDIHLALKMDRSDLEHIKRAHKWRVDGRGISHHEALNPTIGVLISRLYVDVDSVLLHPSPVNVSVDRELYLYALGGHEDESFDRLLCNRRPIKKKVCLNYLLDSNTSCTICPWRSNSPCYFLAEIIATGLIKEIDPSAPDLDCKWYMKRCCSDDREEHTRMVKKLVEYLGRPEEPYIVEGRVDISRFLGSKTFLMQAMVSKYVREYAKMGFFDMGDVENFYGHLYSIVKDYPGIVKKYYSESPVDTRYEALMKEHGARFFGKGTLVAPGCNHHGSHDVVGLADTSECAILSLLCVAFYDGAGYMVGHLSPDAKVREFFAKHPSAFKYAEVEDDWCRVLDSLGDSGIEYRAGRGEGMIAPTIENVCRVVCGLCGIEAAGKSTAEMAAAIHDVVFLKLRDSSGVVDRMAFSAEALEFFSRSKEIRSIEVRSFLSADGEYVDARIVVEGEMRFEAAECTCLRSEDVGCGNIVDYLGGTYLRSYYNKQRMDTDLGHGKYRYTSLGMCEDVDERYVALCLDAVFANSSRHPRLQEIRDLAVEHGGGVVQEVFAAAVRGECGITREVVEGVGMNLLSYLVRHSKGALLDEMAEEVVGAAASNGREDIVEHVSKSVSRDVMERGFVRGFYLLARDAIVGYFDWAQGGMAGGHVLRAYRYGTLLKKYCSGEILTPEVERGAVGYCYDCFSGNDLLLGFLAYTTLDHCAWGYLSKFILESSEYWAIKKILTRIVAENVSVPLELLSRMQRRYKELLESEEEKYQRRQRYLSHRGMNSWYSEEEEEVEERIEETAARVEEIRSVTKILLDIEHEGLAG
jgi:hypothetical protein